MFLIAFDIICLSDGSKRAEELFMKAFRSSLIFITFLLDSFESLDVN